MSKAKATKKPAAIHYRRLDDLTGAFAVTTLEMAIRSGMETTSSSGQVLKDDFHVRVWTPIAGGESFFANEYHDGKNYVFGDLVHFTPGYMTALFEKVTTPTSRAPVKQFNNPDGEFIHSLLYWYIRGNHVFVLQGRTARTSDLERYMSWLLSDGSKLMPSPLHIVMAAKFKPESVGGELQNIEEIHIGGALRPSGQTPPNAGEGSLAASGTNGRYLIETTEEKVYQRRGRSVASDVLDAITGDPTTTTEFLEKIDPDAELKVKVVIGISGKRRKVDRTPLRDLEVGLRNLPDSEVTVKAAGGKTTALGDLQLTYPTQIEVKNSLWHPDSVKAAFDRAYNEFVQSGRIAVD